MVLKNYVKNGKEFCKKVQWQTKGAEKVEKV